MYIRQIIESLGNTNPLSLFSSEDDEEDEDFDEEVSAVYEVSLSESEEEQNWSPPSETPELPTTPPSQRSPSVPPVPQDNGPLAGTLMELLECPVCYEPMQPPIWQCSRGHLVCRVCAPKLRRCPTCRCAAQRTRNCTLEKVRQGVGVN